MPDWRVRQIRRVTRAQAFEKKAAPKSSLMFPYEPDQQIKLGAPFEANDLRARMHIADTAVPLLSPEHHIL